MVEGRKNGVEREIQITRGEERAKIWSGDYHVIRKIWETIMAGFGAFQLPRLVLAKH